MHKYFRRRRAIRNRLEDARILEVDKHHKLFGEPLEPGRFAKTHVVEYNKWARKEKDFYKSRQEKRRRQAAKKEIREME